MEFKSILGKVIELSGERKKHIRLRHPDVGFYFHFLGGVLTDPDEIRQSRYDKNVLLFYKYFAKIEHGKYLVIVIKVNERNFVLTVYLTSKIKTGEKYEIET